MIASGPAGESFLSSGQGIFSSASEAETLSLAGQLAIRLVAGDKVGLVGPLGSGKTLFCRGVIQMLRGKCEVRSPSYSLVNEYPGLPPLYHLDLYRLVPHSDWEDIGLDHYFDATGICLIEWPEQLPPGYNSFTYWIKIEPLTEVQREITIQKRELG